MEVHRVLLQRRDAREEANNLGLEIFSPLYLIKLLFLSFFGACSSFFCHCLSVPLGRVPRSCAWFVSSREGPDSL